MQGIPIGWTGAAGRESRLLGLVGTGDGEPLEDSFHFRLASFECDGGGVTLLDYNVSTQD